MNLEFDRAGSLSLQANKKHRVVALGHGVHLQSSDQHPQSTPAARRCIFQSHMCGYVSGHGNLFYVAERGRYGRAEETRTGPDFLWSSAEIK